MKISKILVPINGSATDDDAISLACSIAKKEKGKVYAIYIIEVKRTLPLDAEIAPEVQKGEQVLDHADLLAEKLACDIETELLQAREVGPAVVDEAIERNVDLIIMGMRAKRRFGEFDLGSTAPYVLKNAPCRVWICRAPLT